MSGKLLLNIIIDNSASLKGEKGEKLIGALNEFDNKIKDNKLNDVILYSLTINKGFTSLVIKNFDDALDLKKISISGLPFINSSIMIGVKNLEKEINNLNANGQLYKPWTIIMLDGENYDNLDESINLLLNVLKAGKMSYFPFALSYNEFDKSLNTLKKIKQFSIVKDCMYSNMFNWIFEFARKRVSTPIEQPLSLDPKSFEGWTIK